MPLRKSPLRTPALVASRRANARKSRGPITIRGKARASLNALKHGRYALHLRRKLIEVGDRQGEALYARIEARVAEAFCSSTSSWVPASAGTTPTPQTLTPSALAERGARAGIQGPPTERSAEDERQLRLLTSLVWCFAARRRPQKPPAPRTILECAIESLGCPPRDLPRTRIQVHDGHRRIGLVFWVQRRRLPGWKGFWERFGKEFERMAAGLEPSGLEHTTLKGLDPTVLNGLRQAGLDPERLAGLRPSAAAKWETSLRSRIFQLRRPNIWQRLRYGLYPDGTYSPELEVRGLLELKKLCLAGIPVSSCPALLGDSPAIDWALIPFRFGKAQ